MIADVARECEDSQNIDLESIKNSMRHVNRGTLQDSEAWEEFRERMHDKIVDRWIDLAGFAMQQDSELTGTVQVLCSLPIKERVPQLLSLLDFYVGHGAMLANAFDLHVDIKVNAEKRVEQSEIDAQKKIADYLAEPLQQRKKGRNGPRTGRPSGNGEPSARAVMSGQLGKPKPKRRGKNGPRTRSGSDGAGAGGSK